MKFEKNRMLLGIVQTPSKHVSLFRNSVTDPISTFYPPKLT